jgi:outer membrane receptor protein involved in Fe transport
LSLELPLRHQLSLVGVASGLASTRADARANRRIDYYRARSQGGLSVFRRRLNAVGLLMASLAVAVPARAQSGSIVGNVVDETGAVVQNARVTLVGPNTRDTKITDADGKCRFENLVPGTYDISVTHSGFSPARRDNLIVDATAITIPIELSLAGVAETVVVSATKGESTLINAPATMTVLPGDALVTSPAQNYGDLLRSVPGINVIQTSARDINMTSRQATNTTANSQLVLVDGRSVYLDFFGLVVWDFLPNVNDVDQIEVVRGPASAVWGANALTGVVNIITKSPRQTAGRTSVILSGGYFDRDVGSTQDRGPGATYSASATTSQIVNDRWSYRLSAGYFNSDPYPRPTGRIPIIPDPRDPTGSTTVGGALYPTDGFGPVGTAFQNRGTSQPKFDVRVDQELTNGRATYAGGVAGTEGIIHGSLGPFHIQPGSVMAYGKIGYSRGSLKLNMFANILNGEAPNLLVPNPESGGPLELSFKTQTYDVEVSNANLIRTHQALSYGGNFRRNNFDLTLAPATKGRNEIGAYVQDEVFVGRFRFSLGARLDKFGNLGTPVFSPRFTAMYQPVSGHSVRFAFNRAFRAPTAFNNYLDIAVVTPVDLRGLAPLLPPALQPVVADPFPLIVHAVGSELPIASMTRTTLKQESLTAYEVAYTGTFMSRTAVGAAFYMNDLDDNINFAQLAPNVDPYDRANPPPGWQLGPGTLDAMARLGIFLPRTAFTYLNLGPIREKGIELSLDHRFNNALSASANYSWQGNTEILADPNPYPAIELALPPHHRFNIGGTYNGRRFLGAFSTNHTSRAFWSEVLTSPYHGFTNGFTQVNGSFGVKWKGGKIITTVKSNNILNRTIQQHVFGDLIRRSVLGEVRFDL